jgi:biotin carboxyl carrier protein
MPEPRTTSGGTSPRAGTRRQAGASPAAASERQARTRRDHQEIARLADELLPALIAKLGASGLGEIEVRESGWKARLRKPVVVVDPRRVVAGGVADAQAGRGLSPVVASHAGRADERHQEDQAVERGTTAVATSPAVGIYHPRRDLEVGMHVRVGDKIGSVDVLGVRQDVASPVAGIVGLSLAEAGEAVEYGQELIRIELLDRIADAGPRAANLEPAGTAGKP